MREVRFDPPATDKQPFALAAYIRNPELGEKGFPHEFERSMFDARFDIILLKVCYNLYVGVCFAIVLLKVCRQSVLGA